jgi:hypothetical protein
MNDDNNLEKYLGPNPSFSAKSMMSFITVQKTNRSWGFQLAGVLQELAESAGNKLFTD